MRNNVVTLRVTLFCWQT